MYLAMACDSFLLRAMVISMTLNHEVHMWILVYNIFRVFHISHLTMPGWIKFYIQYKVLD